MIENIQQLSQLVFISLFFYLWLVEDKDSSDIEEWIYTVVIFVSFVTFAVSTVMRIWS